MENERLEELEDQLEEALKEFDVRSKIAYVRGLCHLCNVYVFCLCFCSG